VEIDEDDADGPVVGTQSWVKNSRAGIEFGFYDEAAWLGLGNTEFGTRPMLLTEINFFGQHPGVRPFQNALPCSMQLSDDRTAVRARMQALESTRHSHVRDTWDFPGFRMVVNYAEETGRIGFVLCMLREPPLPPLRYKLAPVPAIDKLIDALGLSLDDASLKQAFDPLGLQGHIEQIAETGEADFRNPYGLSIDFAAPSGMMGRNQKETLVSSMTLHQEREVDARAWPGELPCGLTFDDSPEMAMQKLGRAPDAQADEDFSGIAVWHEPRFSLRLVYTTMENRLLRVSLVAPGLVKT
jgi:hypothetical protein